MIVPTLGCENEGIIPAKEDEGYKFKIMYICYYC